MFVQWREHEHEEVDNVVVDDVDATNSLRQCGMYNFFLTSGMRAQRRLLNLLIDYWHPDAEAFMLDGQSLTITVDDIYFITGLSRRGEVVNLKTHGGGGMTVDQYIAAYCEDGTEKSGTQIPIKNIVNLSLKVILYMITQIVGSTSLHLASWSQMQYGIECLRPTMFDWSTMMLTCMKTQLTDCKLWKRKNFGFGSVLCAFFFERVLGISPRDFVKEHQQPWPTLI
jgi:hypothetical protein